MMQQSARYNNSLRIYAILLVLLGFSLRLYHLDSSSLWSDEAGQAIAASAPSFGEMITQIRKYAMAMPLDYFITRMSLQLGHQEFLLRFPSVVWSLLTAVLYYRLVARFVAPLAAFYTLCLLIPSPLQIYFAQEMRFYAVLVFFYGWSIYLFFSAVVQPSMRNWLSYVVITVIGTYFHVYVMLSLLIGDIYFFLSTIQAIIQASPWSGRTKRQFSALPKLQESLQQFGLCLVLFGLAVLPGFYLFGNLVHFNYPLFQWGGAEFGSITATGLGLRGRVFSEASVTWGVYEIAKVSILAITLFLLLLRFIQVGRRLWALLVSLPLVIGLIMLSDIFTGYWYLPRQLLFLEPTILMLVAIGLAWLTDQLSLLPMSARSLRLQQGKHWFALLPALLLLIAVWPRLTDMYRFSKGNAREVAATIANHAIDNAVVLVLPAHEINLYQFYGTASDRSGTLPLRALTDGWQSLATTVADSANHSLYLVAPTQEEQQNHDLLQQLGFSRLYAPNMHFTGMRSLYIRQRQTPDD